MAQTKAAPRLKKPAPNTGTNSDNSTKEVTKKEMAEATPRPVYNGTTPATYRVGKKLTPLRKDYKAGTMNDKDVSLIKEVVELGGSKGQFERRNMDAGRLGRLFTFGMVDFEETGVSDPQQIITVQPKAKTYLKAPASKTTAAA